MAAAVAAAGALDGPGGLSLAETEDEGDGSILEAFDIWNNPDYIAVALYVLLFLSCLSKVWLQVGDSTVAEKSEEVRRHRDSLQDAYAKTMAASEEILLGMFESSAYLAEWNFETKRRNFEKFMEHVRDHPERLAGHAVDEGTVVAFRKFVSLWLSVFTQCSVDPIKRPNAILTDTELSCCRTVGEIADLVCFRLGKNEVSFIQLFIKAVKKFEYKVKKTDDAPKCWLACGCFGFYCRSAPYDLQPHEDDPDNEQRDRQEPMDVYPLEWGCGLLQVTLLSEAHFLVLLNLFMSIALSALEIWLQKLLIACGIGVTQLFLVVTLCRINDVDEFAHLVQEVQQLEHAGAAVQLHHKKLDKFCAKLRKLDHLWRYRTVPCLDLFGELHSQLWEMIADHEEKANFLEGICDALDDLLTGLGPVPLWLLDSEEGAAMLELSGEYLNSCTDFIETHRCQDSVGPLIIERVRRTFGVLLVRVVSARALTNKAGLGLVGDVSSPYVTVAVNPDKAKALRTATVEKTLDPVWEEEFMLPVDWEDEKLELHVWGESGAMGEDPSLGFVVIKFRDLVPGLWHKRNELLTSAKKGTKKKDSELTYELYFAMDICQFHSSGSKEALVDERMSRFLADL